MNTNKQTQVSTLSSFAKTRYPKETNRIIDNDIQLSTKLAAILGMLESYYAAYSLNQQELIIFANKVAKEQTNPDEKRLKQITKTSKNKFNKLKNQYARFDKFNKEFALEFTKYLGGENNKVSEPLIDAFDVFWQTIVSIDGNHLKIKKNE